MVRKRGLILTVLMVIILASANTYLFSNQTYAPMAGYLIENTGINSLGGWNWSKIIFVSQLVLAGIILLIVIIRFIQHKKEESKITKENNSKKIKTRSQTDLDVLYNLIKKRKSVDMHIISKIFKIKKEKALEWARILEDNNLVVIDYPTFNVPEVKLKEQVSEKKDYDKNEKIETKENEKRNKKETKGVEKNKAKKIKAKKATRNKKRK